MTTEFLSGYSNLVVFSWLCYLHSIAHVLLVEVDSYWKEQRLCSWNEKKKWFSKI